MADQHTTSVREEEADKAAARGDAPAARALLEQVTAAEPGRIDPWMKLAAMCRALGDLEGARSAVSGALRIDPLAFLPLLLRASLLDATGRTEEAGEAYGHALAQAPDQIPAHLGVTVERARSRHAEHVARTAERLARAGAGLASDANEQRRIDRFASNIVRTTRPFHSEPTDFHYPGLIEREFHDRSAFPWLAALEVAAPAVLEEFRSVMAAEHRQLVPYIDYPDDVPLRQWAELNRSSDWSAIHLLRNGMRIDANARHCPRTMELLGGLDQPDIAGRSPNAMFSLLAPGSHIPPHTGVANTRLVCHLGLIVPDGCWFRVGAETRFWREGEAWVFDDSIEHEARNPSDKLRVILIVDTWHPGLSAAERAAVAALMEATDPGPVPGQ